ncbi:MAG: BolA/IbaG family iron-sulfur metabolism protein [Pseudomonadota bacterium]
MLLNEIKSCVESHFDGAKVLVEESGGHYTVTVVAENMAGLNPVKRQQAVYAPLSDMIADGRLHAVNIRAHTPEEYQQLG